MRGVKCMVRGAWCLVFGSWCLALAAFADDVKVGIIGIDTSHATAFANLLNRANKKPEHEGFRVVAAYQWGSRDIKSSIDRYPKFLASMAKNGVEMVDSIPALLAKVDVVLLETNDGRLHLEQATEVFKSGKRVYVDKPVANTLVDTLKMFAAAKRYNCPFFSSSALRYVKNAQAARAGAFGKVRGAVTYSPSGAEPHHSRYYWYGMHAFEPLVTIMGRGVKEVTCVKGAGGVEMVTGVWQDGRVGSAWCGTPWYGGVIMCADRKQGDYGMVQMGGYEGYEKLLEEILAFFRTGKVPIDPDETIELFAFMEAAAQSYERDGAKVDVGDVLAKAKAEVGMR